MLQNKQKIKQWLATYNIQNYTINDDYTVDVNGSVTLKNSNLEDGLPIQFNIVDGDFDCSNSKLKSLKGSPISITGNFIFVYNEITSLQYCPKSIGCNFLATHNKLVDLQGCPENVGGHFLCSGNQLKTLKYHPLTVGGNFTCISSLPEDILSFHTIFNGNFIHGHATYTIPLLENYYTNENAVEYSVSIDVNTLHNIQLYEKLNKEIAEKYFQSHANKHKL